MYLTIEFDIDDFELLVRQSIHDIAEYSDLRDIPLLYWGAEEGVIIYQDGVTTEVQDTILNYLAEGDHEDDHPEDYLPNHLVRLRRTYERALRHQQVGLHQVCGLYLTTVPNIVIVEIA